MEAAASFWASAILGAVVVPIVHFYGRKELSHILATARPKVFITADEFGRMKYQPDLCDDIPIVGLVGGNFEELLDDEPMAGEIHTDPAAPALIAFTSGTTRDPKGVMHSHQTLGFETRQLLENYPPDRGRQLTATPVGHFIGMLGAFLIPVLEGAPIDLCDVWDPGKVLKLIETEGLSVGGGPPYFVTSLLDHPDCTPEHMARFKTVGLGGSTVPAAVTRRLADMGIFVFRSYGSSEHPVDHWLESRCARGQAALHRRQRQAGRGDPAGPRRRDLQPGTGSVPWLHRRRADRARVRRRRLVSHR